MPTALELGTRYRTVVHSAPSVPFVNNAVQSIELPKGFLYKQIACRLRGEFEGTAGAASFGSEVPLALIQRLEVVGDGRKFTVIAAGRDLYRLSHLINGQAGELVPPASFTAANQPFSASFIIDIQSARMAMSSDSFFDPNQFEKVELRVTWGSATSISAGGTPTIDTANTFLDLQVIETTVGANRIIATKIISHDEVAVVATSSSLRIRVPRTGLLHGILFRTDKDSVAINTMINRLTLQSDNTFNHVDALRWDLLQTRNAIDYQWVGATAGVAPVGYAWLDLTEDGLMSSALSTADLNSLDLILDVTRTTGTELIRMTHVFYEPIIAAA